MERDNQSNNRGRGTGRGRGSRGRGRGRGTENYYNNNNEHQTNNYESNSGRGRSNPHRGDTQQSRPPHGQERPREEIAWNIGQLIVWLRRVLAADPDQTLSNLTGRDANKFRSALDGTVVFERGDMPLMVIQILSMPEIMDNIRTTVSATLYDLVLETKFFLNLETRLRYSSVRLNTENALKLIQLLSHLLTLSPESVTQVDPLIEYFIANEDLYEDKVLYELDSLIIRKDYILQQQRQKDIADNKDTQDSTDYRRIALFPGKEEMFTSPVARDLRKNKVEGEHYDTVDDYLDMHFRLIHEDGFADLRRAVYNLHHGIVDKRLTGVKIYNNVMVLGARLDFKGVFYQVQIASRINWARSKRLMPGSLLCLSSDNFASDLLWATVADRDEKKLAQGKFEIELTAGYDPNFHTGKVYTIIEASAAYFEAFGPVLRALQTKDNLPFQDYLLRYSPTIRPPKYLTSDVQPNNNDLWTVSSAFPGALRPQMHVLGSWPEPGELGPMVDASQLAALEQVLTKEFAIVQGPPGTGKTYVGLQAARLMLENKSPKPILCVCYTNHALDQFLEGIYEFEKKIIRLGGRSKSELMREQCSLFSPHWNKNVDKSIMFQRYQLLDEIADLKNKILDAADKLSASYIGLSVLDTVFHPEQVDTLLTGPGKNVHKSQVVRKWLEEDMKPQPSKTKPVKTNEKSGPIVKPEEVQTKSENVDDEEELDDEIDEDALGELLAEREDEEDTDLAQRQNKNAEAVFNVQQVGEVEDVLTEDQFSDLMNRVYKTNNLWDIDINARRKIHGFLLHEQRMEQKAEMKHLNEKYSCLCRKMKELNHVRTMALLRQANVIGMTTTAAAKNVDLLSALKPKIVIVEEAAEVLEAHIITALTKDTQHLILIGDHQQLRPSTAVYALSKKYNLDVSLFERMTKNKVPYRKLLTQRRMRPEISQLVGPIYNKQLIDHPTVNGHPRIVRGVAKNVFFLDHTVPEQTVGDSTSKVNEHEVSLVANLCLYLVQQGYQPEKITVLTMYLQQLFRIKEQLKENNKIHDGCSLIRVSSVDNFQGEENDIIILSLVRSNNKKSIGFLKISNRVCVALSRARNAFYMIGNAQLLEQESPLWREVIQILRENDNIGPELKLCCQKHRSSTSLIKTGLDFREKAKDGGCSLPCDAKLACGHSCKLLCHPSDKHFCCESCQ